MNRGRNLELKNETTQIPASFSMRKPSVKAIFRGLSLFIEMGHQKAKNRKMGCKNYQMYLFRTRNSHFVGSPFWFLFNKFIPNGIRPEDNNFVTPSQEGVTKLLSPRFFQCLWGFLGFLRLAFQNRPTVAVQPPKEQKRQKNASLFLLGKRFCHFLDTDRNNFRWPVRDVLGIDRGRRRWGSTGSRDGRND